MKSLLFISYVFPPSGGAGVQRAVKFAKYLPALGWRPVVVTPAQASVPVHDPALLGELPPEVVVRRLVSLEPAVPQGASTSGQAAGLSALGRLKALAGRVLFPDRHVLWLPTALTGALAAARQHQAKAVLVTGPPFSAFLLGWAVSRLARLPLVLDFRDDWSGFFTKGFAAQAGGRLWQGLVRRAEGLCVGAAARVIGNTPEMTARLMRVHRGPADKYVWIPNGFDPADFAFLQDDPPQPANDGRLHLLYTGTVFGSHPLDDLWAGFARLTPAERARFEITIVGRVVPGQNVAPGLAGLTINLLPYEPHQAVVRRMAAADALLLTLAGLPGLEAMVPAKLFEYLAVGRPVLAIAPPGAATKIVEATSAGAVINPGDAEGLAALLRAWLADPPRPLGPPPAAFDRRHLTALLARTLDQAAGLGS